MRSVFFLVVLLLSLLSWTASAGWFGGRGDTSKKATVDANTLKKDVDKTWSDTKTIFGRKAAETKKEADKRVKEAKAIANKRAEEAKKKAKDLQAKAKKKADVAAEEGIGLLSDIKTRVSRIFGGDE
jgi:F0F1-type ATP synthase membrane subunit b/b'